MHELWPRFIPHFASISNKVNTDKIALKILPTDYFKNFSPDTSFIQWAAVEVESIINIPEGLESMLIPEGLYAVFHYKGSSADNSIFNHIFSEFLPQSEYELDHRPHFEILGPLYKNNDPDSEEDIYIPIKLKQGTGL